MHPASCAKNIMIVTIMKLWNFYFASRCRAPPLFPVSVSAMNKTAVTSPALAPPVGPFSQAIEVGGFLYVSGQVGQDPANGKVVEGGIVAETERVLQNLKAVLEAAGRSFDHVARAGVYLTSMSDFAAMNGVYARYFSQPFPARTTIAVAALPLGACVEIDLVVKARGEA